MITHIIKRDGTIAPFERIKIAEAIKKVFSAEEEIITSDEVDRLVDGVVFQIEESCEDTSRVTVEFVQDRVECHLMDEGYCSVARAYILYRQNHEEMRREYHEALVKQFEEKSLLVTKRDGSSEPFDINKIKKVFTRAAEGYKKECPFKEYIEAFKKNIVADIQTKDIQKLMVKAAIDLVKTTNIAWQHVAARIAMADLYKQAARNRTISVKKIYTPQNYVDHFDHYIKKGLYYKDFYTYYDKEDILIAGKHLDSAIDDDYEYTTILSFAKRYLLNPNGVVRELPQEMYMSIALFLAIPEKKEKRLSFALELYKKLAGQYISLPTPTLLNSRTNYHQLSSCFKINVDDDLRAIYHSIENVAQISKFGGGVGMYLGNIRACESSIRGVNGVAGGVNPWIKVINNTAVAVNQLGSRKGAVSVTLDVWHKDIYDFLDLQTETGDIRGKAFDIFPAISVPDIFMKRVEENGQWTLFDPHEVQQLYKKKLQDHFGKEFNQFYEELEKDTRIQRKKVIPAKDLFVKFLRTVVETGMPYVFFRDTVNKTNPNAHAGNIYSSQLCTEICQNTSPAIFKEEVIDSNGDIVITYTPGDTVVCNLASVNIAKVHTEKMCKKIFPLLMRLLDNVITLNHYPIKEAEQTAMKYRSVGVGYLGLAEYLATHQLAYNTPEARNHVEELFERYAYYTYRASVDLAQERGAYPLFLGSDYSKGIILGRKKQWYQKRTKHGDDWGALINDMKEHGVRFAYHTAPAPNTSTAGVVGTTAALLPIYKKYFVETNLSAPTIRVAPKLSLKNMDYYQEYISLDMEDVIEMIAKIYPWVDQSISFEWMINPNKTTPAKLFKYYFTAWKKGIKTVYYVRSLSADVNNICDGCSG